MVCTYKNIFLIALLHTIIILSYARNLPSFIPICKRSNPNLDQCILNATKTVQPYLKNGIPELGVPKIEPMSIAMIKLEQGTPNVNYKASLSNIEIHGLSNYTFSEIKTNLRDMKIRGRAQLDNVTLICDYVIKGRTYTIPIRGNGVLIAEFLDVKGKIDMEGMMVTRNGSEYYHNQDTKVKLQIGMARAEFDNLFDGDETLIKVTNEFLHMNAKEIIAEVQPAIETVIAMLVDDTVNKVFQSKSFDHLLPVR